MEKKNTNILFLIKSEPSIKQLAEFFDLPFISLGSKGKGLVQKYLFQLWFLFRSVGLAHKYKAAIGMGVSMNLPMISWFTSMQSIVLDDDDMEATPVFAKYANKASVVITPETLMHENRGDHHITYPGYHELAYLHPNRFTPDKSIFDYLNVSPDERWFVVRFNAFKAHHDIGEQGISLDQKRILVNKLLENGKVFISTESEIEPEFSHLKLPNRPELMHSILAYTTLYVGESQTMTSEAAVLGTPALRINSFVGRISYLAEQEKKYGLTYGFKPENYNKMLQKIDELLALPDLKDEWQKRRNIMLKDKIDVTAFLLWLVENYPKSVDVMKKEPEYAYRFK